jgi:hypothetical protein
MLPAGFSEWRLKKRAAQQKKSAFLRKKFDAKRRDSMYNVA